LHGVRGASKNEIPIVSANGANPDGRGWVDSADFARETLYHASTYRQIRAYAGEYGKKPRHWSLELCLAIIATLRPLKGDALDLLHDAGYTVVAQGDQYLTTIDFLLDEYIGKPIGE
jgi:hypothetical protein